MRKGILVAVGLGVAALTLTGCAPASTGPGGSSTGGSSGGAGSSGAPAAAGGSGPTGKINVCSVFTPAALSAASGKAFGDTLEVDSDGVYGCEYELTSGSGDWIVAVREPSDGDDPSLDGMDLGGPSAVKHVSGTGYPTIAAKAGVELQFGKDIAEVYTPVSASDAQGTTDQFVKVAKALIAAVSK